MDKMIFMLLFFMLRKLKKNKKIGISAANRHQDGFSDAFESQRLRKEVE